MRTHTHTREEMHTSLFFGNMRVAVSGGDAGGLGLRGARDVFFALCAGLHLLRLKPYMCSTFFFSFFLKGKQRLELIQQSALEEVIVSC